jgi:RND family efflux transporter MFP subunit
MLKKTLLLLFVFPAFLMLSCSGNKEQGPQPLSMEQLHAENGIPVSVRELVPEDFSVYLKYPTVIQASSESTAYAAINDVVRTISVRVGDTVRQDDIIVSFSADNHTLTQARLAFENASASFNRTSALFNDNYVSRHDFDLVRMQYEIARANLKAANDMVYVKAPISGTITRINVHPTENVRPGSPLFTVSNQNGYEARFYAGVDEIQMIQTGARVFINDPDYNLEGRITNFSLMMDTQRQSFPVTAFFDGRNNRFVSGISVDISVETYRNENALVLLRRELVETENGPIAYVIEGNKARETVVQTGREKGLLLEIIGGLREGDLIVSEGVQSINSESRLNIVPAILSAGR